MTAWSWWQNVSLKYKLYGLIFLPIALLIYLALVQITALNKNTESLIRATHTTNFLRGVSGVYSPSDSGCLHLRSIN
ncbi:hypothetical protein JCM19238_2473 [Vibrio ponticus]|nr:hypothetical protein JCM19238_2473 [Vibrio ponticus]